MASRYPLLLLAAAVTWGCDGELSSSRNHDASVQQLDAWSAVDASPRADQPRGGQTDGGSTDTDGGPVPVDANPEDAPPACTKSVGSKQAFATIQAAIDTAVPGDVICVHPGTYEETVRLHPSGTPSQPIVLRAASTARPVIDGAYQLPPGKDYPAGCPGTLDGHPYECFRYDPLVSIEGNHVVFEGFEVKRSAGRCVRVWSEPGIHHVTVRNNLIHDCRSSGIPTLEGASEVVIERNEIYRTNNFAPFSRSASALDWGAAACTKAVSHVTYRGNIIHECWGEGFITDCNTGNSGFVTLEDNIWYDNYALVGPYIHATHDVTVRNNLIYFSPLPEFYRGSQPMPCIVVTPSEPQYAANIETRNVTITNNVMAGCQSGIGFWGSSSGRTIDQVKVEHNTFYGLLSQQSIDGASNSNLQNATFNNNLSIGSTLDAGGKPASNNLQLPDALAAGLAGSDGHGTIPALDRGQVQPGWFELPAAVTAGADTRQIGPAGPLH